MVDVAFNVMVGMTMFSFFYYLLAVLLSTDHDGKFNRKPGYWTRIVGVYVIMMANFGAGQVLTALLVQNFVLAPAIIYAASLAVFFLFVLFMILAYRSGKKKA